MWTGAATVDCVDGDLCTTDLCDPSTGCLNPPVPDGDQVACNDGDACSEGDACVGEVCTGHAIPDCCTGDLDCPVSDACTDRFCDLATNTCQETDLSDVCEAGHCEIAFCDPLDGCGTSPETCPDDGDICTVGLCDGATGLCSNVPVPPSSDPETQCNDGLDNDCDGAADGADADCALSGVACNVFPPGLVLAGVDWAGTLDETGAIQACADELQAHACPVPGDVCVGAFQVVDACSDCVDTGESAPCLVCQESLTFACSGLQIERCDFSCDDCPDDGDICTVVTCNPDLCGETCFCGAAPNPNPPEPGVEVSCDDDLDNDCDGAADVVDPDCAASCTNDDEHLILDGVDWAGTSDLFGVIPACAADIAANDPNCGSLPAIGESACSAVFSLLGGTSCVDSCLIGGTGCDACRQEIRDQLAVLCGSAWAPVLCPAGP